MGIELTKGEELWVQRKRLNLTQKQMSVVYKVALDKYTHWERDERSDHIHTYKVRDLTGGELSQILRRRVGMLQSELALAIGCSETWVRMMEKGQVKANRLVEYWGRNDK